MNTDRDAANEWTWQKPAFFGAAYSLALILGNGLIRGIRSYSMGARQEAQ